MSHPGFFDLQHRYEGLDAKGDPLVAIAAAVPFDLFRGELHAALVVGGLRTADGMRKSAAGRKPWNEVLIFKVLVLQALYNLSDDQMEYQLRDRLSFMRFVGLGLDAQKGIWPSHQLVGELQVLIKKCLHGCADWHPRTRSRHEEPGDGDQ